jgi:CBS domain-containing protein
MLKIKECMSRDVDIVNPADSIRHAAELMARDDIGAVPVGENDRLVGMITDRDIAVRAVARGKHPDQTKVGEVMTQDIKYCFEDEAVDRAADSMAEQQIRRLPVVNREKRLVGIISLGDIATQHKPQKAGEALSGVSQPNA